MFKSLKRRGEKVKDKVDFKFGFYATKVPPSGWDKLVVSVISLETGKVSLKTNRAAVKSGNCQWPDVIVEGVKLLQDSKTKDYDEKLFKFIISTGSSRTGVLGDATIDVAEYTSSNNPSQISVPLKNCISGTILHMSVTCLTPRAGARDVDRARTTERSELALEDDEVLSASDDEDLNDSDKSGNITAGSGASNTNVPDPKTSTPTKPNNLTLGSSGSQNRSQKDGFGALRRSSNDLPDPSTPKVLGQTGSGRSQFSDPSSPASSMTSVTSRQDSSKQDKERERDRGPYQKTLSNGDSTNTASSLPPAHSRGANTATSNGSAGPVAAHGRATDRAEWASQRSRGERENGARPGLQLALSGKDGLQADLVAAEATIDELRQDNFSVKGLNRKLSIEVETLKQQLNAHIRSGAENGIEMTTLATERDRLRQELEQVRASMLALEERETGEGNTRWKVEDSERTIRELQEEIRYQKEQNSNLNIQLRKTQDSNMELVLAIKDLEESLDQNRKETEELTILNNELEEHLGSKHRDSSSQLELEWKVKVSGLAEEKRVLQGQLASLESAQFSGKTEDQHVQKLETMIGQLTKDVEELEAESKELADENMELYTNAEQMKKELQTKTTLISQLEQGQKSSQSVLQSRSLPAEPSPELLNLRNLAKELELKLSASKDAHSDQRDRDKGHIEEIQGLVEELRTGNTDLDTQLKTVKLELTRTMKERDEFETQKDDFKSRLLEEREVLEKNLAEATEAFAAQEKEVGTLAESSARAEEERSIALDKIAGLEDDILRLKQEARSIVEDKGMGDGLVNQLQTQKDGLEELKGLAEAECLRLAAQVHERDVEITRLSQQIAYHTARDAERQAKVSQLETEKAGLENSIQDSLEAERLTKSRIDELEFQLSVLSDEMDSVNYSKREFEEHATQLEEEKRETVRLHRELEARVLSVEDEGKAHKEQVVLREAELTTLRAQMETQTSSRRNLERRASDLQSAKDDIYSQVTDLEEENLKYAEQISELEAQLRLVTEERETHKLERGILETRSVDNQNEKAKFQFAAKDHQQKVSALEAKLGLLMHENEQHRNSQEELRRHVQELQEDTTSHLDSVKVLKDRIHDLENINTGVEANLQQMSGNYSVATKTIASLEAEMLVLRGANDEKVGKLLLDVETLRQSHSEVDLRAKNAEETLRRTRWEKAAAVERLQMEVQRLTEQMTSTYDEKAKLASEALVEASELRAEKGEWEERLRHSEEKVKQVDAECSSLKAEYGSRLQDLVSSNEALKSHEQEMTFKLTESLRELGDLKAKEITSVSHMEDLDSKLVLVLSEKEQLEDEVEELRMRVQDSEMLGFEIQRMQTTIRQIKSERDKLDDSAKNLKVLNEYLEEEKNRLEEDVTAWEKENEDLKHAKMSLEDRILRLQLELESQGTARSQEVEQRSESVKLRRQNSEFKRKLTEHEEEKEEFRKRVEMLEGELKERSETLGIVERKLKDKDYDDSGKPMSNGGSPSFLQRSLSRNGTKISPMTNSPSREAKELTELREKMKLLEGTVESKTKDFKAKESILYQKIELLEGANEQLAQGGPDSGMDQLQMELTRLQNLNASLARRERDLQSQLSTQGVLMKEVRRLQEENEQLETRYVRFRDTTKFGDVMEKVVTLETELSEALESNTMYKTQLRTAFATQHNVQAAALHEYGDVDKVMEELGRLKKHSTKLEDDVRDLRERYSTTSLKYAEVSAQKEELVMAVRNLQNGKRVNGQSFAQSFGQSFNLRSFRA